METKPYFVVPYDSIEFMKLKNGLQFNRYDTNQILTTFDKNPFRTDMSVMITLCNTFDNFKTEWKYKGILEAVRLLKRHVDDSASPELTRMINQMQWIVNHVQKTRTMYVAKSWQTDKLPNQEADSVNLDVLMEKLDAFIDAQGSLKAPLIDEQ